MIDEFNACNYTREQSSYTTRVYVVQRARGDDESPGWEDYEYVKNSIPDTLVVDWYHVRYGHDSKYRLIQRIVYTCTIKVAGKGVN